MSRALLVIGLALGLVLLAGCGSPPPEPTGTPTTRPTASGTASPTASAAPSESASAGVALAQPDRPFDADTLLDAMRNSRRPDGVPDQLETDAIASAVADEIWTYAGEPWTTFGAGGSCGPELCTLEIGGSRPGAAGEDAWVFEIAPATGSVEVVGAELAALPIELVDELDALARTVHDAPAFDDLLLTSVSWLPPPDDEQFVLRYRSGGEEGSCRVDLTLDAATGRSVSESVEDC